MPTSLPDSVGASNSSRRAWPPCEALTGLTVHPVVHATYVRELSTLPVVKEIFVKNRWPHLGPIPGAQQFDKLPGLEPD